MNTEVLQNILDFVFKFFIPYLAPMIFVFAIINASDDIISVVKRILK